MLTRAGCSICERCPRAPGELSGELGFDVSTTDVDAEAVAGRPALRAEYGDRLPVVLLDGVESQLLESRSEPRSRRDLGVPVSSSAGLCRGTAPSPNMPTVVSGPRAPGTAREQPAERTEPPWANDYLGRRFRGGKGAAG